MTELALLLGIPLAASLVLALIGHRHHAAEVNAIGSLLTLGLAAEFILKLIPRPAASKVLEVETAGPAEAAALCRRIITEKLWPDGLRIEMEAGRAVVAAWFTGFEADIAYKATTFHRFCKAFLFI